MDEPMIDQESARFIDWAFDQLADQSTYQALVNEAKANIETYFAQDKAVILGPLRAKMIKGAKEHGAPNHPLSLVDQELVNEYLDLLGWLLVRKWNEQPTKSGKA